MPSEKPHFIEGTVPGRRTQADVEADLGALANNIGREQGKIIDISAVADEQFLRVKVESPDSPDTAALKDF